MKPLHDRVIVKPDNPEEISPGGIHIPGTAQGKAQSGTVTAVGDGKVRPSGRVPIDVEVGDHVFFGRYAGTEIELEDGIFLVMREEDILAVEGK